MNAIDLNDIVFRLQEELKEVLRIVQDKGWKHFQKAFGIAAGVLVGVYILAYKYSGDKLSELRVRIDQEMARAQYASTYQDVKAQLMGVYSKMPRPEKKDGWLFDTIVKSAEAQGIVLDQIGSQTEIPGKTFVVLTISVSARVTYNQLGKWLESLENQKPMLVVSALSMAKPSASPSDAGPGPKLGVEDVTLDISTIMPKVVKVL